MCDETIKTGCYHAALTSTEGGKTIKFQRREEDASLVLFRNKSEESNKSLWDFKNQEYKQNKFLLINS